MISLRLLPPASDPLAGLERRLPALIMDSLAQAVAEGLAAARRRLGPGHGGPQARTGRLARSLGGRVYQQGGLYIGELYADAPYAAAQEFGAVIQAQKARYLKFRVQGRWVQKKQVELPARPYLRPGRDQALSALRAALARNLREATK
ncbi:MAG: HK97 gp10 family phage protein [Desulfarculus sp.]|nr:MAG: HK97 gp10 family phage protein [Desulfarculus sp.]